MVQKTDSEVLPGRWCFHVSVLFSLQSRQGLPRWILSHFHQAPPLTDHTAAFKGLSEHQRQQCDFAFLSEHYNLWSPPLRHPMKSPALLAPIAIFNDFPKTHSGFSGTVHQSGRVKWDTWRLLGAFWYEQSHSPPSSLFMMHMYPPWARGGWCESGGRELQITALCVHQWQCGWLPRTKYYLQLTLERNYSSNPLQKEENQLTWQHLERGQMEGQAL